MGMSLRKWKGNFISFLAKKHQYGGHGSFDGRKKKEEREKKNRNLLIGFDLWNLQGSLFG